MTSLLSYVRPLYYIDMPFKLLIPVRFTFVLAALSVFLLDTATAQNATEEQLFREMDKLYTEFEAEVLVQQEKLASTPALALVPLTFDRDGSLLTAKEFNALIANDAWDAKRHKNFWTDFTTYQTVLREARVLGLQTQARVNLVKDYRYVMPPFDARYKGPYLFDPFQKFYETSQQQEDRVKQKIRRQAP